MANDLLKPTILLVDDEQDALDAISMLLEDEFRVLPAHNAEEALRFLDEEFVAAIIADQRMPGMSGVDLLIEVRKQYPQVARVLLTAYADCAVLTKACNEAQIHRYIAKPMEPNSIAALITGVIEEYGPPISPRRMTNFEELSPAVPLLVQYEEDENTSEIAYPELHEDITLDEFVHEAGNGYMRWVLFSSLGLLASVALLGWGLIMLAQHFLD
jgi:response regulator RpfG family c-di-GMP phosphodiesterase